MIFLRHCDLGFEFMLKFLFFLFSADRFGVRKRFMAIPVEEAIAALSTFSLEVLSFVADAYLCFFFLLN